MSTSRSPNGSTVTHVDGVDGVDARRLGRDDDP
jgi:hypothetical protein